MRESKLHSHAQAFHNAPAIGFLQVIKKAKEWARQASTLGELAFRLAALGGFQDPEALASSLTPVQLELISRCGNVGCWHWH